jgi:hypothetical protein
MTEQIYSITEYFWQGELDPLISKDIFFFLSNSGCDIIRPMESKISKGYRIFQQKKIGVIYMMGFDEEAPDYGKVC